MNTPPPKGLKMTKKQQAWNTFMTGYFSCGIILCATCLDVNFWSCDQEEIFFHQNLQAYFIII